MRRSDTEGETESEIINPIVHSPVAITAGTWRIKPAAEFSSRSPTRVQGPKQALGLSSTAFQCTLARNWIGNAASGTSTSIHMKAKALCAMPWCQPQKLSLDVKKKF